MKPQPKERLAIGRPDCRELLYKGSYIDFDAVFKAAESDNPRLRQLAISLYPNHDCTKLEPGPLPQPQPILGDDGKIKKHPSGEVQRGYQEAKSCRYCSVFCTHPKNASHIDTSKWGPPDAVAEFKTGRHNFRKCARAQLACMMAGPMGLSLLKESKYK